jgi:hypothetical protein
VFLALADQTLCSGTQFVLSRDELLTLPEFVLLSLFPNGLFPDGQMNFNDDGVYTVDVSLNHVKLRRLLRCL